MAKFISGRQPQLNVGVSSATVNKTSLQVTGKVGIGTTNADGRNLYVIGDAEVTGVTTANRFSTGPSGVGFNIVNNTITGPSEIILDPAGVGVNTGAVRIKGDLFVDGVQTIIDSTKIELADFNVGIASTVASNVLLDGAGIGIGSENIRKNFTYDYSSDSLKSSENFDVAENKVYKVNEVERLSFNRLQVPHADITGIATAAVLRVTGVSTFDGLVDANGGAEIDNIRIGVADNNEIDTSTGNLTIDSAGGNITIDDNLTVVGVSTLYNTTHTDQAIYRSSGQLRISGGGFQTTRNNILFTNGAGLVIDGGSSESTGVTIKGGGGNVMFTQGRVGIETSIPQSTLDVNGDIRVVGVSTLIGYVDIDNSVDINQKLNVGSGLTVGGYADFNDAVDVLKSLVVGGGTTIGGYVDINSSTDISGSLTVGGGTTIGGYVDINNSVDISSRLNVGSGLTVGGYVDINNSVDIGNDLNVVGIVTALRFESDQSGLLNFFAGYQAGAAITSGLVDYNVVIGYQAGYDLGSSSYNVAIGYQTLYSTSNSFTTGNVAVGYQALYGAQTSDYLVAIGYRAGYLAQDVANSIYIGAFAASNQTITGNQNIVLGHYSAYNITSGYQNTFIGGYNAYLNVVTGYSNISLGHQSLYSISSGNENTAIGQSSGINITTGSQHVLIGTRSGYQMQSSQANTIIGYESGYASDLGDYNTIVGYRAGYNAEDDFGVFLGYYAGYNSSNSYASVYLGPQAGYNAQGDYNIAIGNDAMYAHDSGGAYNIALGYQALYQEGSATSLNIAIGYQSLFGSVTKSGIANIAIGSQSGYILDSGSANVLIGNYAGDSITSGSSNVVIVGGAVATVDVPLPTGSNQLVIGSQSTAWIYGNSSYNVGLGTTNPTQKLDVVGNIKLSGAIHGPTELIIDPAGVDDNTGSVRIKGNLYVDGTQFIVNSSTVEIKDFQVGIASDVSTNLLLDGAGIGIGSTNIRKTLTYDYSSDSLKSSEHFDLAANKTYKINEVEVLRDTQLTIPNAYVSGLGTITTLSGTNLTYTNADIDNVYVNLGIVTTIAGTNLTYTNADIDNAYVTTGIVTTLQGTDVSYSNAYVNLGIVTTIAGTNLTYTTADIDNAYVTTGIVTTLQGTDVSYTNAYVNLGIVTTIAGTNLTYTNADIDNAYVTTGIVTTLQGTDVSYTNAYVNTGVTTTLAGTNLTYTNADIDNAYVTTGIVTTLQGTDVSYTNAYVNTGVTTTLAGTNLTYTNADIDNAYVTTGIVTTLQGTDVSYTNAYINVGVVTTLSGTNLTYTNISNVGGISTLGVTTATNLSAGQLDVSGLSTFRGNVRITTGDFLNFGDTDNFSILFGGSETFLTQHTSYPLSINGNTVVNIRVNGAENAIVATANGSVDLYYDNSKKLETTPSGVSITGGANLTGVATATEFHTGASGSSIRIASNIISGPSEITIDPAAIGDNTGSVRIKGDLYVDGAQTFVDSTRIELADFNVGIASTVATNVLLDGAGIGIGSTNIRKTLTYDYSSDSLKSSEHFDLAANKTYKINEVEVLRDTQLTIPNAYVSGLGTITTLSGTNLTYTNADIDNAYVTTGIVTTISGTNLNYTNATIENLTIQSGIITAIVGTLLDYQVLQVVSGVATDLSGTNLTYTNADIDNAYITAGIITTVAGTNLTYTNADIDNLYATVGVVTTLTTTNGTITNLINTHFTSGIATITTIYGYFDGELNAPGKTYYVATNGSDSHTGDNINQPFATLAHALSVATSGDTILVGAGTFTEIFPLTIPIGVSVKGTGIRSTFIQPTAGTKQNDGFLLNGETTVEDLSLGNFFEPGYGFRFANNCKTTTRSPYIQRVTVLNKGSVTSVTDPYGFDTAHSPPTSYKAGRGVLIDGSVVAADTLEPAMLFNECTFICPNNTALEMTNGGRTEWVNCFSYFADKAIYSHDGNVGLASTGYVRVKTTGIVTSTSGFPTTNDEIYYLESNPVSGTYEQVGTALTITKVGHGLTVGDRVFADFTSGTATDGYYSVTGYVGINTFSVTMAGSATTSGNVSYQEALGFGTIRSYTSSSGLSSITGKGEGLFELPTSRPGKTTTAYGDAQLSTTQKKIGTASLYLDGTGDYARCEGGTDLTFSGNFTAEAWIYPTSVTGSRHLFALGTEATGRYHLSLESGVVTGNFYGSSSTTFGGSISINTWTHIALVRSGSTITAYVDGTALGTTETNSSSIGNTGQLTIGADTSNTNTFVGYIDEVRISNTARYTGTFTPSTSAFNSDGSDKLLLHLDGVSGSTSFIDSSIPSQDIRWVRSGVGIATATKITLADYQQFGGDMRSIGSAAVFGNTGVTADGPGSTLRLFAFNFGHIGSGKDFSQDVSLVNQANEVITSNNGKVYYASIDQSGDFRVGEAFYVSQENGTVNFGSQDFTLNSLSDLNISDGTNTTTITPTSLSVGNLIFSGNDVTTTSGDININPSGNAETNISGNLNVSGILTASVLQTSALQKGDTFLAIDDTGTDGTIRIGTDAVEALRINNGQFVGIGTENPTSKFHVVGDTKITGVVTATAYDSTYTKSGSITATTTTTSQVSIHSTLSSSTYRSVEYLVQATEGTNFHTTKILAVHDGTNVYVSEYGTIYNNQMVATYDVDLFGGNLRLLATPAVGGTTTFKVVFTSVVI